MSSWKIQETKNSFDCGLINWLGAGSRALNRLLSPIWYVHVSMIHGPIHDTYHDTYLAPIYRVKEDKTIITLINQFDVFDVKLHYNEVISRCM